MTFLRDVVVRSLRDLFLFLWPSQLQFCLASASTPISRPKYFRYTKGSLAILTFLLACTGKLAAQTPATIWASTATPTTPDVGSDSPVELGVRFYSDTPGYVTGIRFYKSAANTGAHIGNLWSSNGTLLASASFTSETASGWQQVNFSGPVAITANTPYLASYHATIGHYAGDASYFATAGVNRSPLHTYANSSATPEAPYTYGGNSQFPASTYNSANYWVDVAFTPATPAQKTIWPSTARPTTPDVGSDSPVELGIRFYSDTPGYITGIRFYKSAANTGAHIGNLWSSSGTLLASATFTAETASGWQHVNFSGPVAITANTAYVASYHTPIGHYAADASYFAAAGVNRSPLHTYANTSATPEGPYTYGGTSQFPASTYNSANYWVDVAFTASTPAQKTIWPSTASTTTPDVGSDSPVELGVRFYSDTSGYVTGMRFYKSAANTGAHIGNLWSSSGTLLASATFTAETASGWQHVNFSGPVAITANTAYVASYHTTIGHYAGDASYFAAAGVNRSLLHTYANTSATPEGPYTYGSTSQFPASTYNSANYWVDVAFAPATPAAAQRTIWPSTATP